MEDTTLPIIQPSNELPEELASAFHQKVLDSLHDGVYFVDRNRKILYWNKGAELLTGYTAAEVIGSSCFDNILMHVTETGCSLCANGCQLQRTIQDGKRRESEVYFRHKFGHRVPVSVRVAPIMDRFGNIVGAVEIFTDVSAKKHIERRVGELENLVFLDALTSVSNRRFIELKVKQAIQEVEQFDRQIGVLMIDLDDFKAVNDDFGHAVGDEVLKSVCNTLHHSLRSGDLLGRWGGEELLILVTDVTPERLRAFAERCRMLVAESFIPAGGHAVKVTVSVGATIIRKKDTERTAVRRADELMYRSKTEGKNRVTTD
jgi:diguanylate cyclase (GGDEF)-like protein/PAS domain S-box-containing protein